VGLLAIPNVSEGRDRARIGAFHAGLTEAAVRVLDVHSDGLHHRSVFTTTGSSADLAAGMTWLAGACRSIDLAGHDGAHPRLGALDVCPVVPFRSTMEEAVALAHSIAPRIGALGIPVFLYGHAARREETRSLPGLRRGGLAALAARIDAGLAPDEGPPAIDPAVGVVCVGARGPLIAFNVVVGADLEVASEIARSIRVEGSLQALALPAEVGAQVSMNLIAPEELGIEQAFALVVEAARRNGTEVVSTELVGLVEERFLPGPDAQVARLLLEPGHSLESALGD
jgi:glutamate formiminotransferase